MFPVVSARAILHAFSRLGFDRHALQAAAGISNGALERLVEPLQDAQFGAIWAAAMHAADRPTLVLEVAQGMPVGSFAPVDLAAVTAGTVGGACAVVAGGSHVFIGDQVAITIDGRPGGAMALSIVHATVDDAAALTDELILAVVAGWLTDYAVHPLEIASVTLLRPRPVDPTPWERWFRAPVTFGVPSSVVFSAVGWRTPLRVGNAAVHQALGDLVPVVGGSVSAAARSAIRRCLASGAPIDEVAASLGLSARTLQRRLREEGVSFRDLLDAARREEAERLLSERRHTLTEVASRVGFGDHASFSRAFVRWTGRPPTRWDG